MVYVSARRKVYDILVISGLFATTVALLRFPRESVAAAIDGLALSFSVVIPALFPFFVLSNLMVSLGLTRYLDRLFAPMMRPLFNVSGAGASALVLGLVGGYPVGAKTAVSLYESGRITKSEAERLLAFCNNAGPAFVFGVVGVGIFASSHVGVLLYLSHVSMALCIGILFRFWRRRRDDGDWQMQAEHASTVKFAPAFIDSVVDAVSSTLRICGFVTFFAIFTRLLFFAGIIPAAASLLGSLLYRFDFGAMWAQTFLVGLTELSSGVWNLRELAGQVPGAVAMAAFMLGWAGTSVHCQVFSFVGQSGLSVRSYLLGKFLHGTASAAFIFILDRFIPFGSQAVIGVEGVVAADAVPVFAPSPLARGGLLIFILLICVFFIKKTRQTGRNTVYWI